MKEPFCFLTRRAVWRFVMIMAFVAYCCLLWYALVCFSPVDAGTRRMIALSGVWCTIGQTACLAIASICRRVGVQGWNAYWLAVPFRTGVFLICAFVGLLNCDVETRRAFALCVICGYFGTYPLVVGLTFPSEKEACQRAVEQRAKKDALNGSETSCSGDSSDL